MTSIKATALILCAAVSFTLAGAAHAQNGLLNQRPGVPVVPSTGVPYWLGNQPPASVYEEQHPVAPLMGRQFQQRANAAQGGTYSGDGFHRGNNGGYYNNGYGGYNSTTLVPDGNGGYIVLGGNSAWSNGTIYGSDGYAYTAPSSNQAYQVPLTQNDPNGPYITVLPNPTNYIYSGDPIPIAQQPVTNVYNTYNYYSAPAQQPTQPSAVQPSATAPSAQPAAAPAPTADPSATTPASGGAGAVAAVPHVGGSTPAAAAPDDADLLAAAYKDIQRCWVRGDIGLLKKHTDPSISIQVMSGGKYQYNIATDKFVTSTDDLFDQIQTQSFTFTTLRKLTNGDIAAYATQVYNLRANAASGKFETIYVAYVMSKRPTGWVIAAVDSSSTPIVQSASAGAAPGSGVSVNYSNR